MTLLTPKLPSRFPVIFRMSSLAPQQRGQNTDQCCCWDKEARIWRPSGNAQLFSSYRKDGFTVRTRISDCPFISIVNRKTGDALARAPFSLITALYCEEPDTTYMAVRLAGLHHFFVMPMYPGEVLNPDSTYLYLPPAASTFTTP